METRLPDYITILISGGLHGFSTLGTESPLSRNIGYSVVLLQFAISL